jgi:hypothetical protein
VKAFEIRLNREQGFFRKHLVSDVQVAAEHGARYELYNEAH